MNHYWSQDLFLKAFYFASDAHNNQKLPGSELPYMVHITSVCIELMAIADDNFDWNLTLQCAALHDVIEDTKTTYQDLENGFGKNVADGVLALSKDYAIEKSIQVEESINRILKQPKEIWMVKMADRISNLRLPPVSWSQERKRSYFEQSKLIHNSLKDAHFLLGQRLEDKILKYQQYFSNQ